MATENLFDKMSFMDIISEGKPGGSPAPAEEEDDSTTVESIEDNKPAPPKNEDLDPEPEEAEEEEEQEGSEPDAPASDGLIGTLAQSFGITLEEGESYEETEEGLISFTKKAAEHMAMQNLEELFEKLPDVQAYMEYRMNGGDAGKYMAAQSQTDYTALELKEDDVRSQKTILVELMSRQGYDQNEIDETLQDYEDTGILYKQSKKAQSKLSSLVKTERESIVQAQAREAEKRGAENTAYWNRIQETVEKGELKGIKIPETEKKKFYDWMNKPIDKQGTTARALQRKDMDTETLLALEYMFYKKLDLGGLVTTKAKTIQAQSLRDRLNTSSAGSRMGSSKTKPTRQAQLPSAQSLF